MSALEDVQNAWGSAASQLGFEFVAPFAVDDDGIRLRFDGYVRDFGGPNGTVFFVSETFREDVSHALRVAKAKGYFHSQISAEIYRSFDREVFLEVLRDWGWFGPEASRPKWLDTTKAPSRFTEPPPAAH